MGEQGRDTATSQPPNLLIIGRYVLGAPIARGGMATIHIARLTGAEGFSRIVAAKRLNPELTEDTEFVAMFLDEARIASKVHHPNVVPVLDVVTTGTEIVLVQEYIHGVPFSVLLKESRKRGLSVPIPIAVTLTAGVLAGLHAAHEAKDELGQPLEIVHRDVSPQNVMIAIDGTARLLDFGVAKATLSAHVTREGTFKGKIAYTAPEQLRGVTMPASDLYSTAVMLWEALVGKRMHEGITEQVVLSKTMTGDLPTITDALNQSRKSIPEDRWEQLMRLEPVVMKALKLEPEDRFQTAAEMEQALVAIVPRVQTAEVAVWMKDLGETFLAGRSKILAHDESSWRRHMGSPESGPTLDHTPTSTRDMPTSVSPPSRSGVASRQGPRSPVPPMPPPPPERRRRTIFAIVAAAIVLGASAGVLARMLVPSNQSNEAAAADSTSATARPSAPPAQAAVVPPAPAGSASASASATADVTATPVRRAPPTYVVRRTAPTPTYVAPAPTPTSAESNCNPPFYFDGKKKLYKPGCI
jgi:serine/threonine protein kinase